LQDLSSSGSLSGFFYGLIEINLSKASLNLLSGDLKGREYPLTQRLTTIGSSPVTVINLPGYTNIEDVHAEITQAKDGFYLSNTSTKNLTYVNDDPNKPAGKDKGKKLEDGDIIRIGNAQFEFKEKK
jgi:predicted component of type VI protein secretion system